MATLCSYDYREPTAQDLARFPVLKELFRNAYYPKIVEVKLQQEAPDTTAAEIQVDYTSIFDGTGTAAVVYYDSSSASDTAAGTGVRTIKIFGINEAGTDYQEITDSMAGATGTATAEKFQRLGWVKAVTAGSGGTAAGTITIQDDAAGTNKHMTMAASTVSSVSARLWICTGYSGFMAGLEASCLEEAHATAAFTANSGLIFTPIWETNDSLTNDEVQDYMVTTQNGGPYFYRNLTPVVAGNGNDTYISLKHVTKEADNNIIGVYRIWYIIYKTAITDRGFIQ